LVAERSLKHLGKRKEIVSISGIQGRKDPSITTMVKRSSREISGKFVSVIVMMKACG